MWRSQAEAEGLTLLVADNNAGYFGVHLANPGQLKPYAARLKRGAFFVTLTRAARAVVQRAAPRSSPSQEEAPERALRGPRL